MKEEAQNIATGIGMFFVWLIGITIVVIGFFVWLGMLLGSFAAGSWGMAIVILLFSEVIIPVMGFVSLLGFIF